MFLSKMRSACQECHARRGSWSVTALTLLEDQLILTGQRRSYGDSALQVRVASYSISLCDRSQRSCTETCSWAFVHVMQGWQMREPGMYAAPC